MKGYLRSDDMRSCGNFDCILTLIWPQVFYALPVSAITSRDVPEIAEIRKTWGTSSGLSVCATNVNAGFA